MFILHLVLLIFLHLDLSQLAPVLALVLHLVLEHTLYDLLLLQFLFPEGGVFVVAFFGTEAGGEWETFENGSCPSCGILYSKWKK